MTYETVQVFSGSPITPEELLVLAEFAAPSHFVSDDHLRDAAENLADWTDHESVTITRARCGWRRARMSGPASSSCSRAAARAEQRPPARAHVVVRARQSARPPPSSMKVCPVT